MEKQKKCDNKNCDNSAMHTQWHPKDGEMQLCCNCYVKEGNPPSDWHPDCMKAYDKLKKEAH